MKKMSHSRKEWTKLVDKSTIVPEEQCKIAAKIKQLSLIEAILKRNLSVQTVRLKVRYTNKNIFKPFLKKKDLP